MQDSQRSVMLHPLHPNHPLVLVNASAIYEEYSGRWKCDHCHQEITRGQPYHCQECSFDLCQRCYSGINHSSHPHPLFYINTEQQCYQEYQGLWQCDACSRSCRDLNQTNSYHCEQCMFDICVECFQGITHPMHEHDLFIVDTSIIYHQTAGQWKCDCCGKTYGQQPNIQKYARHCNSCNFDLCLDCVKEKHTDLHPHPLLRADSRIIYSSFNGCWSCDNCGNRNTPSIDYKPYHCNQCDFDLCEDCFRGEITDVAMDVVGPPAHLFSTLSMSQAVPDSHSSHNLISTSTRPVQIGGVPMPEDISNLSTEVNSDRSDEEACIICLERPRNATIVHHDTGHICCCLQCAYVLKQRNEPCPICRQPIDSVIRQFNV